MFTSVYHNINITLILHFCSVKTLRFYNYARNLIHIVDFFIMLQICKQLEVYGF